MRIFQEKLPLFIHPISYMVPVVGANTLGTWSCISYFYWKLMCWIQWKSWLKVFSAVYEWPGMGWKRQSTQQNTFCVWSLISKLKSVVSIIKGFIEIYNEPCNAYILNLQFLSISRETMNENVVFSRFLTFSSSQLIEFPVICSAAQNSWNLV